jgi:hypothetical protein
MGLNLDPGLTASTSTGPGLSRLRWGLALAVAGLTLVAAVQALVTYLSRDLTVGVLAVGALAVTLVAGLGSLASARRRIGAELVGLRASPPSGKLIEARQRRLAAIQSAGARPDLGALADAAAAEEAGQAYIGRYLVATTVLIGLVGTFAGLMETLGHVAPLLAQKDQNVDVLALLASPLGGLHVTFGASLVAILATLALALAQGDLALSEAQALALLEDRTTHELVPSLWPPAEEAAERTARAMAELRGSLADAVVLALEKSARRMAEGSRADGERAARALESTATAVEQQLSKLVTSLAATLEEGARRQSAAITAAAETALGQANQRGAEAVRRSTELAEQAVTRSAELAEEAARRSSALVEETARRSSALAEETVSRFTAAAEEAVGRFTGVAEAAVRESSAEIARTLTPLFSEEAARLDGLKATLGEAATGIGAAATRLEALGAELEGLTRSQIEAIGQSSQTVRDSFDRAVLGAGTALDQAAGTLAGAATDLRAGVETVRPALDSLTRELGALGREVALLMAARGPESDLGAVVLGELERLGSGVDRLNELLRLGGARAEEAEDPAAVGVAEGEPAVDDQESSETEETAGTSGEAPS